MLKSVVSHLKPIEFTFKSLRDSSLTQDRKKIKHETIYGLEKTVTKFNSPTSSLSLSQLFNSSFVCLIISSDN